MILQHGARKTRCRKNRGQPTSSHRFVAADDDLLVTARSLHGASPFARILDEKIPSRRFIGQRVLSPSCMGNSGVKLHNVELPPNARKDIRTWSS